MEDVINFTAEQFLRSEPYDYLVRIESPAERDHAVSVYRKFAQKTCGISAATFKAMLAEAAGRYKDERPDAGVANMTNFPGQEITLRCPGYICNDHGVWTEGDWASGSACVCLHPIMPVRRIVNYDTGEQKVEIAYCRNGRWQHLIVPKSALSAATRIVQPLSEYGVAVNSETARLLVQYFTRMEEANIDLLPEAHSATRMGWIDEHRFLPYEDGLLFDGQVQFRQLYDSLHEHGSPDAWFDLAREVRRGRNVATRAMLAASFASVLIKPLRKLPFMVHCWTDVSGVGKTVALMLAASVWADPNEGAYVKNFNTTNVGFEMVGGFLGSLPMCMDELCLKDGKGYHGGLEDMIYQFCEGVGRARGSRNGGAQQQVRWNCCAITTGETPLVKPDMRAGAVNRVLELDVEGERMFEDPITAANTIRDNYGFAGKRFVQALQKDGAIEQVTQWQREYYSQLSASATEKQAMVVSLLLAADRFAAVHVFDDVYNLRPEDFAHMTKRQDDVDTNIRAYNWLMGVLAENNQRFEPTDEHYRGEIWGKLDETGPVTVACIISSRFSALMNSAGYDERAFRKWAKRRGLLDSAKDQTAKLVRLSSLSTPTRCICVRMNAFDEQEIAPDGFVQVDMKKEDIPF